MTAVIKIELLGPPRGKGRPRFRIVKTKGGQQFVSAYTDAETRYFEASLQNIAKRTMGGIPPMKEPLAVEIIAYMPVPESWSQRKKDMALGGEIVPTGKPDVDNLSKTIDSLNKVVWLDDSQIVDLHVWKFFSAEPRLVIEVRPWPGALLNGGQVAVG